MDEKLKKEIKDLKKHFNEITTSDLQGIAGALSRRYNTDDEIILKKIYGRRRF